MGWKGVLRRISLVAAVVAAPGLRSAAAGEDDLNPQLRGMAERKDKDGCISIRLPEPIEEMNVPGARVVAHWGIKFNDDPGPPHMQVFVGHNAGFSNARLYASQTDSTRNGKLDAGSVVKGARTWTETRTDGTLRSQHHFLEAEDSVFEVGFICAAESFPIFPRHVEAMFASFKVLKAPALQPPEGFRLVETSSRRVWTDVKSKAEVEKVAAAHAAMWARMNPLLPPLSSRTVAPLLIVCREEGRYAELTKRPSGGYVSPYAVLHISSGALIVAMAGAAKNRTEFDKHMERLAGVHAARSAYGGPAPYFAEQGLALLGVFTTAKGTNPQKPLAAAVRATKEAVKRRGRATLSDLLPLDAESETEIDVDLEVWAWHWYFGDAAAQEDGKRRYREYMRILAETGDAQDARAVWEGTDWAALDTAFETWLAAR